MNEIVLLQSAQTDLMEIYSVYGDRSYQILDRALEAIRRMPEHAPVYWKNFRRKVVRDTPFGIFYSAIESRIFVSFILDLRQDPKVIAKRLRRES